jgi:hypothetical protein
MTKMLSVFEGNAAHTRNFILLGGGASNMLPALFAGIKQARVSDFSSMFLSFEFFFRFIDSVTINTA